MVGFVLIALIMIEYVKTGESYTNDWPVMSYNLITRILLFSCLFRSAFRLLKMIKKYSIMKPSKLVWSIYTITAMVGVYIPYHVICLIIDLFHQEKNSEEIM